MFFSTSHKSVIDPGGAGAGGANGKSGASVVATLLARSLGQIVGIVGRTGRVREQYVDISLTVIRRPAAAVGRFPGIVNETTGLHDVEDAIEG